MKPRTGIVLGVLLAMCAGYVIVRHTDLFESPSAKSGLVFGRTLKDIRQIRIVDDTGSAMAFVRQDGRWRLTAPLAAPADDQAVAEIVGVLADLTSERALPPSDKPEQTAMTGLGRPMWTIQLTARDGAHTLLIGQQALKLGSRTTETYVQVADTPTRQPIHAVATDFEPLLRRPLKDFRDKTLVSVPMDRAKGVIVEGKRRFSLHRDADGWRIVTDRFDAAAAIGAARDLVAACTGVTAVDFADETEDLGRYGLEPGKQRLSVTIELSEPDETITLLLGRPIGKAVYAKRADRSDVVLVANSLLDDLQPDPAMLRDRRVLTLAPGAVSQIKITGAGDGPIDLVRSQGQWRLLAPLARPANGQAVETLLAHITRLQARRIHDNVIAPGAFGLDEPAAEVTLYLADSTRRRILRLGGKNKEDHTVCARVDEEPTVMEISADDAERLLASAARYCGTTLLATPPDTAITRLVLQRGKEIVVLQRDSADVWSMLKPRQAPVNDDATKRILHHLNDLQADEIVAIAPQAPRRFVRAKETVSVTVTATAASADSPVQEGISHVLRVVRLTGEKNPKGVFAWLTGSEPAVIGRVNPRLLDILQADLRSTVIWQTPPETVDALEIRAGGAPPLVLVRQDDRWQVKDQPTSQVNGKNVTAYLAAIEQLKATRFVPDSTGRRKAFDLHMPWMTVVISAGGRQYRLVVSARGPDKHDHRYAAADHVDPVFVLSAETVAALTVSPDTFLRN